MNPSSRKMDSQLTGMWVNFFTAAGIPSDVGATYSLTFAENRIQTDMLLDLNKEYLKDMGITRMGDVIAILRHAKQVHESAARDRVLSSATAAKVPVAAVAGRLTAAAVPSKVCTPASRILERYTRNTSPEYSPPRAAPKRKSPPEFILDSKSVTDIKKSRLIRFGNKQTDTASEVSVPVAKQTVFARLGSETAKVVTATPGKPIFSRLGAKTETPAVPNIPVPRDALKYEGILKAPVASKVLTVTSSKDNVRKIAMAVSSKAAGNVGASTKVAGTMRADEAPLSVKEKLAVAKPKSVKFSNTIEYKEIAMLTKPAVTKTSPIYSPVFNKPERRLTMPDGVKLDNNGVKARLGSKDVKNFTITKNVFNRLGA